MSTKYPNINKLMMLRNNDKANRMQELYKGLKEKQGKLKGRAKDDK